MKIQPTAPGAGTPDWYLVIPFSDPTPEDSLPTGLDGSAQVFVTGATSEEEAAQVAFDHGYVRCWVLIGAMYENPEPQKQSYPGKKEE